MIESDMDHTKATSRMNHFAEDDDEEEEDNYYG
jgi:hypothetical protein